MFVVGLTGGIGSGKSTIAKLFSNLGVPVYIADVEAKKLTDTDKAIKERIVQLFGEKAYTTHGLDRAFVANIVFKDKEKLAQLNAIIHPAVKQHFLKWAKQQQSLYVLKEAAILFENDGYKDCDATVLVIAPKEQRIERVIKRDHVSREQVLERMNHQWDDEMKMSLATYIINNPNNQDNLNQIHKIHLEILQKLN
ncbi:dephospho-CoA kinase [Zhouia sp. PK063]|uniref:dephospho-CoA kinase n=1 Tax=Zhouia sp. PK063 TaxID=3373602 RepID=UPI0037B2D7CE